MTVSRFRWINVAAVVALVVAGCGTSTPSGTTSPASPGAASGESPIPGVGDTLRMLVGTFGNGQYAPMNAQEGAGGENSLVMATLLEGTDNILSPGIAEAWQISDDGLTWTFDIRDDVKFHNGETVTADDVVFSLQDTFGPEAVENSQIGALVRIASVTESIEKTDEDTVAVTFKEPVPHFGAFVSNLTTGSLQGGIMPKAYFEEVGRDGYNAKPIGAGPYKYTEFVPGQKLVLERFDDYYAPERLPKFDKIEMSLVPELATRVQALNAGDADIIQADLTVRDQVEGAGNQMVYSPEAAYVWTMLPGCWDEALPCNDVRVRQALDLAIDKPAIMGQLYGDSWQNKGWEMLSPSALGYAEGLDPKPFDATQAKQLLADAGYPDGEGFPKLVINVDGDSPDAPRLPDLAQLMSQQWEEVLGIETEVLVGEEQSLDSRRAAGELDGQVWIRANGARYDGGSLINSIYGGDTTNSNHITRDPRVTDIVAKIGSAFTPEERQAAYEEAYRTVREESYELATGSLALVWGVASRLQGWQPTPLRGTPSALWTITPNQ